MPDRRIASLPVFGLNSWAGTFKSTTPCTLDQANVFYTTSGRAAILLALEVFGIGPGDSVLLPTYHCPTMVAPTALRGATPMFYPIDAVGTPNLAWLETQDLRHVRVMLAAHYFGAPQPMGSIREWCGSRGIALIEDCAHAMFGLSGKRPIGAWGNIAICSLTKFFPVPEGGCLIFNSEQSLPRRLNPSTFRNHVKAAVDILEVGALNNQLPGLNGLVTGFLRGLRSLRKGRNGNGAALPCRAGNQMGVTASDFDIDPAIAHRAIADPCRWVATSLPRSRIVDRRRRNFEFLQRELTGLTALHPLLAGLPDNCAPYVFPLWLDTPDPGYAELRRLGVPVFRWDRLWPSVPNIPGDMGRLWSHHVLQLACHQDLTPSDLEHVVCTVKHLYGAAPPSQPSIALA